MEGGEEVGEERERKCSQERGGGGISVVRPKEINFSTSWGASCAVILMTLHSHVRIYTSALSRLCGLLMSKELSELC